MLNHDGKKGEICDQKFPRSIKNAILLCLLSLTLFWLTLIFGHKLLSYRFDIAANHFYFHTGDTDFSSLKAMQAWDGHHYLRLVEEGYKTDSQSAAFYPLYPFLIRTLRNITPFSSLICAILLAQTLSVIGGIFCFRWARAKFGEVYALRTLALFLVLPGAFFTKLPYSEALFLALFFAFLTFFEEKKFTHACICALFLPLSRAGGILLALIPCVEFVVLIFRKKKNWQKELMPNAFLILAFGLGFGSYLLWMDLATGDAFIGFKAQEYFSFGHSLANVSQNLLHLPSWLVENFSPSNLNFHGIHKSFLDRTFLLVSLAFVPFAWRHLGAPLLIYVLVALLLPVFSAEELGSTIRLTLAAAPLFLVASKFKYEIFVFLLSVCVILQTIFIVLHVNNYWIA